MFGRGGGQWVLFIPSLIFLTLMLILRALNAFNLHKRRLPCIRLGNLDKFPYGWIDPLELYGAHLIELMSFGCSLDTERDTLKELIVKYGANWIWDNRHRLAPVAKCLKDYPRR